MQWTNHTQPGKSPASTALVARDRLLCDTTLRNHAHAITLSPAEQHERALQIVHCFKYHYLVRIEYRPDCQATIAFIKAVKTPHLSHEIGVDAAGNVSIYHRNGHTTQHRLPRRAIMLPGTLFLALGLLLLTIII